MKKTDLLKHLKTCIQDGSSNLSLFPFPFSSHFLDREAGRFWQRDLTTFLEDDLSWELRQPLIQGALVSTRLFMGVGAVEAPPHPDSVQKAGSCLPCPILLSTCSLTHPLSQAVLKGCPWSQNTLTGLPGAEAELREILGVALKIGLRLGWLLGTGVSFRDGDWERSRIPQI